MATITPPDAITYEPVDASSVRLRWRPVAGADRYIIRGGGTDAERSVTGTEAVVRGLIPAAHMTMEIRSAMGDVLSVWEAFDVRTTIPIPPAPVDTPKVPVLDVDRQSVQLRLPNAEGENVDVLLRLWWQPSDAGWWASIEVPVNNPVISSRRLGVNCGIFDDTTGILAGNIVMRATGEDMEVEPTRRCWRDSTHALAWEAA